MNIATQVSSASALASASEFRILRDARLPPLAWLVQRTRDDPRAHVLAGAGVRHAEGVFWEGVNPCVDSPRAVIKHHFPLCSGALIEGDDLIAFTPGHSLDRLFVAKRDGSVFISNSLPFVLEASGVRLAPRELTYRWHLGAIFSHRQNIPAEGGSLSVFHIVNIVIDKKGGVRWEPKSQSPDFETYAQYRVLLDAHIQDAVAATGHPINHRYAPITMISSGYDSPATSTLSRLAGANTALTVTDARHGGSDSGAPIAEALGLHVETLLRTDYLKHGLEAERLFYIGAMANDIVFYPWKERLRSALLFSGYKGDMLWDRNWPRSLGLWGWDSDGTTMQEMRLRADFVHFPPAYYGWSRSNRLLAISRSADMAPWTLYNNYDRPIARRIAEEAGVARDLFGQKKKMVTSAVGVVKEFYVGIDDLGLSEEFREFLCAHRRAHAGLSLDASFHFNNGVHRAMRFAHGAVHAVRSALQTAPKPRAAAPRKDTPTLKDRIFFELEFQLPERRKYMAPFTDLNFAAQVANALVGQDYASAIANFATSVAASASEADIPRR